MASAHENCQGSLIGWPRTGIFSCSRRLMPMVMVVSEEGHEPHAPCSFRYTTGPSISTSSTFPPSARSNLNLSHALHDRNLPIRMVLKIAAQQGHQNEAHQIHPGFYYRHPLEDLHSQIKEHCNDRSIGELPRQYFCWGCVPKHPDKKAFVHFHSIQGAGRPARAQRICHRASGVYVPAMRYGLISSSTSSTFSSVSSRLCPASVIAALRTTPKPVPRAHTYKEKLTIVGAALHSTSSELHRHALKHASPLSHIELYVTNREL